MLPVIGNLTDLYLALWQGHLREEKPFSQWWGSQHREQILRPKGSAEMIKDCEYTHILAG